MGAIGDEPSVELLPRLLVGPPRGGEEEEPPCAIRIGAGAGGMG